jgi:tRNA 2-(methylsulfanyl)-N6-isopentenyladenosine37 hydroxylase
MLRSATPAGWFAAATENLEHLVSDHLHCERKAAEHALQMVRRYVTDTEMVIALGRLAHEETSHVVQVSELLGRLGYRPRPDRPNLYARALLAEVRTREPERKLDALLVAGLIEARSHERLTLLAHGFAARRDEELAALYRALAHAEDRHAELYRSLASRGACAEAAHERLQILATREAEILAALPMGPRVH